MKILVTFAIKTEYGPWGRLRGFLCTGEAPFVSYEGMVAGTEVSSVLTGMGPERARKALCEAERWNPDACIATGLAGSRRSTVRREEFLVSLEVIEL